MWSDLLANEQLVSAMSSILATIVGIVGIYLMRLLNSLTVVQKAKENEMIMDMLRELSSSLILRVQKKYTKMDGSLKEDKVVEELQMVAGKLIERLGIGEAGLRIIVHQMYEAMKADFDHRF